MKLQQYLLNDYLRIEFESFSHKAVAALGILTSIKHNPLSEMQPKEMQALEATIQKVQTIIDVTRDDIQISLFILDRNIIPQDFSKTQTNYATKFTRKKKVKDESTMTLSQDQIQALLCQATMEIHILLMAQIAGFSEQMFFDGGDL